MCSNVHIFVDRFHKLVWGCHGMEDPETPSGYLVGGADNGNVFVWNPAKLLENQADPLVYKLSKHTGAVAALDVNPFQVSYPSLPTTCILSVASSLVTH